VPYHDLSLYFRRADIGLATFDPIPLLKYAFPLKVVEYLSAGLPVIASEGTESARIVTEFQCGSIVTYGNSDQLKEAVIDLLKDSQRLKVFAENAVKGGKQFSWEQLMDIQFKYVRALFPKESAT
jgi:glycosyltransferase involved in cell wall biosynthesis